MVLDNPTGRALMVWGAPGIGKTGIVNDVIMSMGNRRLVDIQTSMMLPDDWALPHIIKTGPELKDIQAVDVTKDWLPTYIPTGNPEEDKKKDEIANMGDGGILFFDELSRASSPVQNTCLKLINERRIGQSVLGSKWAIISASNRDVDDPDSDQNFSLALGNRFAQINFVPDFESYKEWGMGKVDPRILDFLEFNQEFFYTLDNEGGSLFASPRSWKGASDAIKDLTAHAEKRGYKLKVNDYYSVISSEVGQKVATEFMTFMKLLETFTKEDIREVLTNPEKARMPKKAGSGYDQSEAKAVISVVCSETRNRQLTPDEFNNYIKYLIRLDNASIASVGIKMIFDLHPYMHEEIGETEGHDKYKEGVDMWEDKYGDRFK